VVPCVAEQGKHHGNQAGILWEGDKPRRCAPPTYLELRAETCRIANVLMWIRVDGFVRSSVYASRVDYRIRTCLYIHTQ
jgi:acyl-coenzyme A synthetase/AMP-(fatty) acid ligase